MSCFRSEGRERYSHSGSGYTCCRYWGHWVILECDGTQHFSADLLILELWSCDWACHQLLKPGGPGFVFCHAGQKILDTSGLIWLSFAYSRWIRSRCGCGHGAGDSAGDNIPGSDSTQSELFPDSTVPQYPQTMDSLTGYLCRLVGACSFWFGLLSHAFRPRKEAHPGTLAGLLCCSACSHHCHVLHIKGSKKPHINHCDCMTSTFFSVIFQRSLHPLDSNDSSPLEQHSTWLPIIICCVTLHSVRKKWGKKHNFAL